MERKNKPVLPKYKSDKLPPQDTDLEEVILGACILEPRHAFVEVEDLLHTEVFYKPAHQLIWQSIIELKKEGHPIDILTVSNQLKKTGNLNEAGGPYFITQLTSRVASAANIRYHALIINQNFIRRELIKKAREIENNAWDESIDVLYGLDEAQKSINGVTASTLNSKSETGYEIANKVLADINKRRTSAGLRGISSGFEDLDAITMGWQPEEMIVLAARPSMGKTALAINLATNATRIYKKPVGVFSLEMSKKQLIERAMCSESGIEAQRTKGAKDLTDLEFMELGSAVSNGIDNLIIDDEGFMTVLELRAKARRMMMEYGIQMIIIDYIQLLRGTNKYHGNREAEISEVSRSIKSLAKELHIPIIALSQLSRETEKRANKEPGLSDLRESGAIEQDADIVMFLHRPEYYGMNADANGNSTKGLAQIIIAKQRNGPTDRMLLDFNSSIIKFTNHIKRREF
jgi:replicative DNA helicase